MLRRLILMRHAKSSWATGLASDHARPLNPRGRRDAPTMAAELVSRGWVPDHARSSDAQRTRETWGLMEPVFGHPVEAVFERGLYQAGLGELRASARGWDAGWGTVLALGHNPGWSLAATALGQRGVEMTTANCALLEGEGATWAEALEGGWRLVEVLRPGG